MTSILCLIFWEHSLLYDHPNIYCGRPYCSHILACSIKTWWRHQMETFSALPALRAGNSPVNGEFPSQRPVMRSFDIFFDLRLNKQLSKQSGGWWFETPSCPLWRHCNENIQIYPRFDSTISEILSCKQLKRRLTPKSREVSRLRELGFKFCKLKYYMTWIWSALPICSVVPWWRSLVKMAQPHCSLRLVWCFGSWSTLVPVMA